MAKNPTAATESKSEKRVRKARDKVEAFKSDGKKRMNKALAALANVAKLANAKRYTFDDAQVSKINAALAAATKAVADGFANAKSGSNEAGFDL